MSGARSGRSSYRSPRKTQAEWDRIEGPLRQHYLTEGLSLEETMQKLHQEPWCFSASVNQFKSQMKKWGIERYVKERVRRHVVKVHKRHLAQRPKSRAKFTIAGRPISGKQLDRMLRDLGGRATPKSKTPSIISYRSATPSISESTELARIFRVSNFDWHRDYAAHWVRLDTHDMNLSGCLRVLYASIFSAKTYEQEMLNRIKDQQFEVIRAEAMAFGLLQESSALIRPNSCADCKIKSLAEFFQACLCTDKSVRPVLTHLPDEAWFMSEICKLIIADYQIDLDIDRVVRLSSFVALISFVSGFFTTSIFFALRAIEYFLAIRAASAESRHALLNVAGLFTLWRCPSEASCLLETIINDIQDSGESNDAQPLRFDHNLLESRAAFMRAWCKRVSLSIQRHPRTTENDRLLPEIPSPGGHLVLDNPLKLALPLGWFLEYQNPAENSNTAVPPNAERTSAEWRSFWDYLADKGCLCRLTQPQYAGASRLPVDPDTIAKLQEIMLRWRGRLILTKSSSDRLELNTVIWEREDWEREDTYRVVEFLDQRARACHNVSYLGDFQRQDASLSHTSYRKIAKIAGRDLQD